MSLFMLGTLGLHEYNASSVIAIALWLEMLGGYNDKRRQCGQRCESHWFI